MWMVYDAEMKRHSRFALDTYLKFDGKGDGSQDMTLCRRDLGSRMK
jgi:hypothetical protein